MPSGSKDLRRLLDSFDWEKWNAKLRDAIDEHRDVSLEQGEREADQYDLDWDADDPFLDKFFSRYAAERVTQIDETTRDKLADELSSAWDAGEGQGATERADGLRDALGESYALSPSRALTIARTETAIRFNQGGLLAYDQNGITHVEVSDGDGDEECAEADGQIWTIDDAMDNPVEHPNCVRSFAPVVEDDDQAEEE